MGLTRPGCGPAPPGHPVRGFAGVLQWFTGRCGDGAAGGISSIQLGQARKLALGGGTVGWV